MRSSKFVYTAILSNANISLFYLVLSISLYDALDTGTDKDILLIKLRRVDRCYLNSQTTDMKYKVTSERILISYYFLCYIHTLVCIQ